MRCLSIRQPWASLIVAGHKDIENRSWATPYRGPLLIHASSKADLDADTRGIWARDEITALPRGGIIGVVYLRDCVTASTSPWFTGPIGWVITDPLALPFQRCAGQLSLFEVTPQKTALRAIRQRYPLPLFGR